MNYQVQIGFLTQDRIVENPIGAARLDLVGRDYRQVNIKDFRDLFIDRHAYASLVVLRKPGHVHHVFSTGDLLRLLHKLLVGNLGDPLLCFLRGKNKYHPAQVSNFSEALAWFLLSSHLCGNI